VSESVRERERAKEGGWIQQQEKRGESAAASKGGCLGNDCRCLPLPLTGSSPAKWMMSLAEACVHAFCIECSLKKRTSVFFISRLSLSIRNSFLPLPLPASLYNGHRARLDMATPMTLGLSQTNPFCYFPWDVN